MNALKSKNSRELFSIKWFTFTKAFNSHLSTFKFVVETSLLNPLRIILRCLSSFAIKKKNSNLIKHEIKLNKINHILSFI